MAVVNVSEQFPEREGSVNVNNTLTYNRYFLVTTDDLYDAAAVVIAFFRETDGLPWIGDTYTNLAAAIDQEDARGQDDESSATDEEDDEAVCVELTAKQRPEDGYFWDVTVRYTNMPEANPDEFGTDPTEREVEVEWGSQIYTKSLNKDWTGRLIANSTGLPFTPPPETEFSYRILTLRRWEHTGEDGWDATDSVLHENAINQKDWQGFTKRTVKCKSITGERKWIEGKYYWRVTYIFHIKYDTWLFMPIDAGFQYLKDPAPASSTNLLQPYLVAGQSPGTVAGLLDGQGRKLNGNGVPTNVSPALYWDGDPDGSGTMKAYQLYPEQDFDVVFPGLTIPS